MRESRVSYPHATKISAEQTASLRARIEKDFGIKVETFKNERRATISLAIIILGAKMSAVNGRLTADEIATATNVFHVPFEEIPFAEHLFRKAGMQSGGDCDVYAGEVAAILGRRSPVLEKLLGALVHIAEADGVTSTEEAACLERIAAKFGFDKTEASHIHHAHAPSARRNGGDGDWYGILNVTKSSTDEEIKTAYHELARKYHPDHLISLGLPSELVGLAEEKMAQINTAYREIEKARHAGH